MAAFSSFPSSVHVKRFDVFPSFHGPDVRRGFLSHLHNQFASKGITTFKDEEIERGHTIGSELVQAIRESRVLMVVLSKHYASSSWCLDELVEILKCRKDQGQIVMPIFYDVDPSHVRKQSGDFGIAFEKTCEGETEPKKRRWIEALENVATIAGEHSRKWTNEAAMIKRSATDVLNKLNVEAFRGFDVDQNGFISAAELRYVLTIHGQKVTDEEVEEMIRKADVDGDGRISYDEFVKLKADGDGRIGYDEFVKLMAAKMTDEEAEMVEKSATSVYATSVYATESIMKLFMAFDVDQSGFITAADFQYVMKDCGEKLTDEEVEAIRKADVDGDGRLNYDEFFKYMMAQINEAFRDLDVDQNGFITAAEFQFWMKNQGHKVIDEEVEEVIREVDVDGDGRISYDEFVKRFAKWADEEAAMVKKSATDVYATDVTLSWEEKKAKMELFMAIDVDQNGFITAAEYQFWLKNKGDKVTDEEAEEIIRKADFDGDGRMNFDEFVKLLNKWADEEAAMVKKSATDVYATDVTLSWEEKKVIMKLFMELDVDQNGFITAAEYQYWLKNHGKKVTDKEARNIIRKSDFDGDGRMNFDEFVNKIKGNFVKEDFNYFVKEMKEDLCVIQ